MALEKMDGCSDAYVDPETGITLMLTKAVELDEKALQTMLTPYRIQASGLRKIEKRPY